MAPKRRGRIARASAVKRKSLERRSCVGKVRYRTLVAAGQAADRVFQATGEWVRPYPCRFCSGFHVGH